MLYPCRDISHSISYHIEIKLPLCKTGALPCLQNKEIVQSLLITTHFSRVPYNSFISLRTLAMDPFETEKPIFQYPKLYCSNHAIAKLILGLPHSLPGHVLPSYVWSLQVQWRFPWKCYLVPTVVVSMLFHVVAIVVFYFNFLVTSSYCNSYFAVICYDLQRLLHLFHRYICLSCIKGSPLSSTSVKSPYIKTTPLWIRSFVIDLSRVHSHRSPWWKLELAKVGYQNSWESSFKL